MTETFGGKYWIGDCWENTKYVIVEQQPTLPVYTITPWNQENKAHPHYVTLYLVV